MQFESSFQFIQEEFSYYLNHGMVPLTIPVHSWCSHKIFFHYQFNIDIIWSQFGYAFRY